MTVLRHRERPHEESPEAFGLQRNGQKYHTPRWAPTPKPHSTTNNEPPNNSNAKTTTFQEILAEKAADPEHSLQFYCEYLRLVHQVKFKLQLGNLIGNRTIVRFGPGNIVVRVTVLHGAAVAAQEAARKPLFRLT